MLSLGRRFSNHMTSQENFLTILPVAVPFYVLKTLPRSVPKVNSTLRAANFYVYHDECLGGCKEGKTTSNILISF